MSWFVEENQTSVTPAEYGGVRSSKGRSQWMAAATLRESKCAPSAFATLLRRSQFASFDPNIAQIYTNYGGHAHRGNWGLKRPLALTKRKGQFITLRAIDSKEQQTEWYNAETAARWVKVAPELGKEPTINSDGQWSDTLGTRTGRLTIDSDYSGHKRPGTSNPVPQAKFDATRRDPLAFQDAQRRNPASMTAREFTRHIDRLQHQRPQFKKLIPQFMLERMNNKNVKRPQKLDSAARSLMASRFLGRQVHSNLARPDSTTLLPAPHTKAGLVYTHGSNITNKFLYSAFPGRVLSGVSHKKMQKHQTMDAMAVGVSGLVGRISKAETPMQSPAPVDNAGEHAKGSLFVTKSLDLWDPPRVVGPQSSIEVDRMAVYLDLKGAQLAQNLRSNPHIPGSQAYVSHADSASSPHGGSYAPSTLRSKSQKRSQLNLATRNNEVQKFMLSTIQNMFD